MMPSRDDIELLVRARRTVIGRAQRDLYRVFSSAKGRTPEVVRDVLLEAVPALVDKYGDVAATAAADWYLQMRAKEVPGAVDFPIVLSGKTPSEAVEANVRYAARFLFGDDPAMTVRALHSAIDRHVKHAETGTLLELGSRDSAEVKFALVPRPPMTCAFCLMLSSRGWEYTSEETASEAQHDHCDCSVVPSWDWENAVIDGFDLNAHQEMYGEASKAAEEDGDTSPKAILRKMRELYPDDLTDGAIGPKKAFVLDGSVDLKVWRKRRQALARKAKKGYYGHEALARRIPPRHPDAPPTSWPGDLPTLSAKAWNHILYGYDKRGGHLPGYGWVNEGTPFPVGWTKQDIADAAEKVLRSPDTVSQVKGQDLVNYEKLLDGRLVRVGVGHTKDGRLHITTCHVVEDGRRG